MSVTASVSLLGRSQPCNWTVNVTITARLLCSIACWHCRELRWLCASQPKKQSGLLVHDVIYMLTCRQAPSPGKLDASVQRRPHLRKECTFDRQEQRPNKYPLQPWPVSYIVYALLSVPPRQLPGQMPARRDAGSTPRTTNEASQNIPAKDHPC
jgi:hypothetical protein